MSRLEIYSRDPDLIIRSPLPWTSADLTLTHLGVGAWSVTMPATDRARDAVSPGWGMVAVLDGRQVMSGSVEDPERERTTASYGVIEATGADDMAVVAGALAWPTPGAGIEAQGGADARSGPAESVLKGYVAANIGLSRAASRRDPAAPDAREVAVAPDLGRGLEVDYRARFDPLMDIIRAVHGGLGVTCQQLDGALVFDVFEPADRLSAVFSFELGNLVSCRWRDAAPEVTHAIVGGEGEGGARTIRMRSDSVAAQAWRMSTEVFVDERSETTTRALDRAGDEALADARRAGIISAQLVDTARMRFGEDYDLGDRVTIAPEPGVAFTDVITSVHIRADRESGELTITPSVGWQDGLYQTRQDREISQLQRAVSALERSR